MLNAFAKAGFEHLSRLEHDQEGHRSIRVGEIIFWFDSENLVRVQLKRILVCQPAELR
jgi:plasmid maintenance system killer protein